MGRLFGTNGVRGIVGETMTPELALRLGRAVGTWSQGPVLVGRDTRTSGPLLERALIAGIVSAGADVLEAGVVPTPSLQRTIKDGGFGAGAIVTASHNPPEFNGIKCVAPDGTELDPKSEAAIEDHYFDQTWRKSAWDEVGTVRERPGVNARYIEAILDLVGEGSVAESAPKVVVDCANGAACDVAPELLRRMGAHVIALNAQPDGAFPGHPSEPTPENVASTLKTVRAVGADMGVILDGDADRCVMVTHDGGFVPGERTLALVAGAKVEGRGGGTVVTPVSSSQAVEDHVVAKGGKVRYTAVGSPIVAREMMRIDALFGGEENGGLIFPEHQHCRDGSMTLAWLVKHVVDSGQRFADLLSEVPAYALVKLKVPCPDDRKASVLEEVASAFDGEGEVDTTDGVKVYLDEGWILVRPSGTEPLFRVFAEAKDPGKAKQLAARAKERVEAIVG